ncbi:MAG: tyrosine-type recombinase/integrase [Lachnospiraceae bacterium]|nr:tyrosine-type recombinase/integrase [Lachnospiraceae bacterium]
MEGRKEIELKNFAKAEKKLETLPSYVTSWYYKLRGSYIAASTCRDYVFKISKFLSFINEDPMQVTLEQINEENVTRYMISKETKDVSGKKSSTSDSLKLTVWYALKSFLSYLAEHGMIKENYILNIIKKKNHDLDRINRHRVLLTVDDFNNILNNIDDDTSRYPERDYAIVRLYMITGMRKTALSSINIEDIDFNKKIISVIDKGDIPQEYPINDALIRSLKLWINKRKDFYKSDETNALFISKRGNRISGSMLEQLVKKYTGKALPVSVSPHKLRSGLASIMYEKTGDIEKVRRIIGHKNISTTQRYIVTEGKERKEASKMMDSLLV